VAERWLTRRYERSAGPAPDVAVVDQTGR
jgi:hypothetical protein